MSPHETVTPIAIEDFSRRILSLYKAIGHQPATVKTMARVLRELASQAGVRTTADLTTDNVAVWMAENASKRAAVTVVGLLGYVRASCTYAVEEGLLGRPPNFRRLKPRVGRPKAPKHLPWEHVSRLLSHLRYRSQIGNWSDQRTYALTSLIAYTGLRRNEALFLRRRDVDLTRRIITLESIPERTLKTPSSGQPVPIPPELADVLAAWMPEALSPWLFPTADRSGAWHTGRKGMRPLCRLKVAAADVGIERITWQMLRHTWATHAETRWSFTREQAGRVLRQTQSSTTALYQHADEANLVALSNAVSYQ